MSGTLVLMGQTFKILGTAGYRVPKNCTSWVPLGYAPRKFKKLGTAEYRVPKKFKKLDTAGYRDREIFKRWVPLGTG